MSLFPIQPEADKEAAAALQPLAERMRPRTLDEFIGQEKLLGPGKPIVSRFEMQVKHEEKGALTDGRAVFAN